MQTRLIKGQNFYAKPFLKWAGGKRQLLDEIHKKLPINIKKSKQIKIYYEPFLGGGSVFFYLKNNFEIEKSIISDINPELMLTYKCIQTRPEDLKEILKEMQDCYDNKKTLEEKKKYYEVIRKKFNDNINEINLNNIKNCHVERAAQTIFMNKTCFNGLFRVNKEGKFNVPMGKYKNPKIYDPNNIDEVHNVLNDDKKVTIKIQDYLDIEKEIITVGEDVNKDSFVYLDPPYRPISKTSSFTDYYKDGFSDEDQINLCNFIQRLTENKANVMLSNSQTDDDFFEKHYSEQNIHPVKARRYINSNAKKRNEINELIITNYSVHI